MENSEQSSENAASRDDVARAVQDAIMRRAGELYQLRGCVDGHAMEDWLQAEAEILGKMGNPEKLSQEESSEQKSSQEESSPESSSQEKSVTEIAAKEEQPDLPKLEHAAIKKAGFFNIKVDGVLYTVEYDPERCDAYRPGMLRQGQPVELRFEDDKVFMKLPNSRELEAKIVRKCQA